MPYYITLLKVRTWNFNVMHLRETYMKLSLMAYGWLCNLANMNTWDLWLTYAWSDGGGIWLNVASHQFNHCMPIYLMMQTTYSRLTTWNTFCIFIWLLFLYVARLQNGDTWINIKWRAKESQLFWRNTYSRFVTNKWYWLYVIVIHALQGVDKYAKVHSFIAVLQTRMLLFKRKYIKLCKIFAWLLERGVPNWHFTNDSDHFESPARVQSTYTEASATLYWLCSPGYRSHFPDRDLKKEHTAAWVVLEL